MLLFPFSVTQFTDESDRAFMEWIFVEYRGIMFYQAYDILRNDDDAEDILTECWITLCKHIKQLQRLKEKSDADLKRYIVRSVRNASLNLYKRKSRKNEVYSDKYNELANSIVETGNTIEEDIVNREEAKTLYKTLRSIPSPYYETLQMKYIDGMDDAQIGIHLGISANSVRAYVSTARRKAKKVLSEGSENEYA